MSEPVLTAEETIETAEAAVEPVEAEVAEPSGEADVAAPSVDEVEVVEGESENLQADEVRVFTSCVPRGFNDVQLPSSDTRARSG